MKIILVGNPIPQIRMRHSNFKGFTRTYDPKSKEKNKIKETLMTITQGSVYDFPRVSFIFYMPIPKSTPKRLIALHESETLKHDKKPDVDNLIKLYLDCMDGIVLQGDQKVSLGPCIKLYSANPRTVIWVNETKNIVTPQELDCTFLSSEPLDIPSFSEEAFQNGWHILGRSIHLQSPDNLAHFHAIQSSKDMLHIPSVQV